MTRIARWGVVVLALALLPAAGAAQQEGRRGMRPPAEAQERRAELEREIRQQFLTQLARRLELSAEQRGRLATLLEEGAEARRALALESREVRRALMTAVRDDETAMGVYERLLVRIREIGAKERALEEREAAELAEFLDARQQAMFLTMRMQLNDRVRRMQGGGPRSGAGGPGDGPAGPGMGGRVPGGTFGAF